MAPNATPELLHAALVGKIVATVERRGKYVIVGFTHDVSLVVHRKMSGNLVLRTPDAPLSPYTHLTVTFEDGSRLDFVDARKFGRVYLFLDEESRDAFLNERLGPEPLEIEPAELARRLTCTTWTPQGATARSEVPGRHRQPVRRRNPLGGSHPP